MYFSLIFTHTLFLASPLLLHSAHSYPTLPIPLADILVSEFSTEILPLLHSGNKCKNMEVWFTLFFHIHNEFISSFILSCIYRCFIFTLWFFPSLLLIHSSSLTSYSSSQMDRFSPLPHPLNRTHQLSQETGYVWKWIFCHAHLNIALSHSLWMMYSNLITSTSSLPLSSSWFLFFFLHLSLMHSYSLLSFFISTQVGIIRLNGSFTFLSLEEYTTPLAKKLTSMNALHYWTEGDLYTNHQSNTTESHYMSVIEIIEASECCTVP